jgi:hypothetical protein
MPTARGVGSDVIKRSLGADESSMHYASSAVVEVYIAGRIRG